jgi:riboflavin kinase/FMN adenylyltransferase
VGRRLGFPTANLDPHNEVLPPYGVYAVHACLGDTLYDGVMNVGTRPTFIKDPSAPGALELHILELHADIYGENVEVFFVRKLRDERPCPSPAALREQIHLDVASARDALCAEELRKKLKDSLYTTCSGLYIPTLDKQKRGIEG